MLSLLNMKKQALGPAFFAFCRNQSSLRSIDLLLSFDMEGGFLLFAAEVGVVAKNSIGRLR